MLLYTKLLTIISLINKYIFDILIDFFFVNYKICYYNINF